MRASQPAAPALPSLTVADRSATATYFWVQCGCRQDVRSELRVPYHPGPRPWRHARGNRHGRGLPAEGARLTRLRAGLYGGRVPAVANFRINRALNVQVLEGTPSLLRSADSPSAFFWHMQPRLRDTPLHLPPDPQSLMAAVQLGLLLVLQPPPYLSCPAPLRAPQRYFRLPTPAPSLQQACTGHRVPLSSSSAPRSPSLASGSPPVDHRHQRRGQHPGQTTDSESQAIPGSPLLRFRSLCRQVSPSTPPSALYSTAPARGIVKNSVNPAQTVESKPVDLQTLTLSPISRPPRF